MALEFAKRRWLGGNAASGAQRSVARDQLVEAVLRAPRIAISRFHVGELLLPLADDAAVSVDRGANAGAIQASAEAVAALRVGERWDHDRPPLVSVTGRRTLGLTGHPLAALRSRPHPLALLWVQLVQGRVGDRRTLHLTPAHLSREIANIPRRLGRDKHLRRSRCLVSAT